MNAPQFAGQPEPLPVANHEVMAFDDYLLPESLRGWVVDICERIQCPPDFPAIAAMTALSSVVGRRVGIRPQQKTDWTTVPNLWGAIIGRPGIMKTPAINEALKPLKRLEIDARQEFNKRSAEHAATLLVYDAQRKESQRAILAAVKEGNEQAIAIARGIVAEETPGPTRTRYLVNDASVEKLGEILNQNPLGHVLSFRDELSGWLIGLDKSGQEQSRSFYLESWNGDGRFSYDRIGRGTIDIEAAIISVLGGIQPGPLQKYMAGNTRAGSDDGLIQRFQLMVWPDVSTGWRNVDRWPDSMARDNAHNVYFELAKLNAEQLGAQREHPDDIPFLRFAPDALELFVHWRTGLEQLVRSGNEHPAIESHLAKYRSLVPSLALLDHLADVRTGAVGIASVHRAINWAKYLESHARRVYGATVEDQFAAARELGKRIEQGQVKGPFAARDVYRNCWAGLSDSMTVEQAADVLVDHNWIAIERKATAGRTATVYYVNPALQR